MSAKVAWVQMDQCSLGLWCAWFLAFALVSPANSLTVCGGTEEFLDGENVLQFEGCEKVNGNLIINQLSTSGDASVPLTYNKLLLLSTIREIDGYLSIDSLNHPQIRDLRFLRQLEVIHGNQTLLLFGQQEYSLVVQNNHHLRTLNLASLRRIENGGVRINSNPNLCLVDTIAVERYLVNSRLLRVGGLGQDCTGVYCHEQCEQSSGCWGVIHDECVNCRNYQYMDTCVEFCNGSISYPMETTMQCLPITATTDGTVAPTPPNSTSMVGLPLPATITDMQQSTSSLTPSQRLTTTTNLPSTTLSIGSTEGESTTSHLILSISVVGGTLILSTLGLLVICLLYRQAKKRKKARASLLPKKVKASFLPKKGPEAAPLLIQRCLSESEDSVQLKVEPSGSLSRSTCTIRKSRVSLGSPSSKSEVQGYERHVGGVDCEPRSNTTPRINTSTPAVDVLCSDQNKVVEDGTCADFRVTSPADITPRISADSGCYDLDIESHDNHMTTAANHGPRRDARCDDDKYLLTVPHFRPSSTSSSHSRSSRGTGVQSSGVQSSGVQSSEDSTDLEPLFANWKPSLYHPRVSPAMQRPVTMGGVYSTGHHPQHHRNRSYGNNQRGSLTSSHGTGTSTRTSAMTSRSTSQQAGSLGGGSGITGSTMVCGYEVVGSVGSISGSLGFGHEMSWASVRQSKTSSQ